MSRNPRNQRQIERPIPKGQQTKPITKRDHLRSDQMALDPKIQSPCPYKNNLAAIMDGDVCRMCKRHVFDLSGMSDVERDFLIKGCKDEICVSYKFPIRPAIAAAALAAAVIV